MRYLLETDQGELATTLVFLLTGPIEDSEIDENDEQPFVSQNLEALVNIRLLDQLFEEHTEKLYDVCGASFIDVLEKRLQTCLEIISDRFTNDIQTVNAFRRPSSGARWNPMTLEGVLVPALETAIEYQASTDPDAVKDRLRQYIHRGGIYWQVAAHLLSQQPAVAPQVVSSVLQPSVDEDVANFRTEYLRLLNRGFSELSESEQQEVIEYIERGLEREKLERRFRERDDWDSREEIQQAVQTSIERWKLVRFWQIRDYLPAESEPRATFDELRDRYGDVQFDHVHGYSIEPPDQEAEPPVRLDEMDPDGFIEYCLEYAENATRTPRSAGDAALEDGGSEAFVNPSEELRTRILSDQEEYLQQLPSIVKASTGTDELVQVGFEAVVTLMIGRDHEDDEVSEWQSIVDAYECFLSVEPIEENWDRDCRRAAAYLFRNMISHVRSTFEPTDHIELLAEAVLTFTTDPDPEPLPLNEDQLHTVRAIRRPLSKSAGVRANGTSGLIWLLAMIEDHSLDAELVAKPYHERLIDLLTDDTMTVRFALGRGLSTLHRYDSAFVKESLDQLLPTGDNPENRVHFISTWLGYINYSTVDKSVFDQLTSKYQHAVALHRTANFEQHDQSLQPLCEHIAVAYAYEYIDADDKLVQELLQIEESDAALDEANEGSSSPAVHVANAFNDVLRAGENKDGHHKRWERIIKFWERRMKAITSPTEAADELRAYARILRYAPSEQSLTEIKSLLCETAPGVQFNFAASSLLEYLERKTVEARHEPAATSEAAIEVLEALIRSDERIFSVLSSEESWTIVRTAAEDGHETALIVAERFLKAGYSEYRRIIDDYRFDD